MIRRVFWTGLGVGIGASVGILAARKARRTAEKLTPSALAGSATGALSGALNNVGDAIRGFAADVREGMAEREAELSEALGFTGDPYPEEPSRSGGR